MSKHVSPFAAPQLATVIADLFAELAAAHQSAVIPHSSSHNNNVGDGD
ncbi:MAG: hypothetical protein QOD10_2357 [Mycobacterium sp.]|jgi:hypothetical protein|nr:hypothetical protein [Mycobacterium sp.]